MDFSGRRSVIAMHVIVIVASVTALVSVNRLGAGVALAIALVSRRSLADGLDFKELDRA